MALQLEMCFDRYCLQTRSKYQRMRITRIEATCEGGTPSHLKSDSKHPIKYDHRCRECSAGGEGFIVKYIRSAEQHRKISESMEYTTQYWIV